MADAPAGFTLVKDATDAPPPGFKLVAPEEPLGPGNLPPGWAVPMPGIAPQPIGAGWSDPPMSTVMGIIGTGGLLGAGGAAAEAIGVPALVGKMGAASGLGYGQAKATGKGSPALSAIFDAALVAATDGLMGAAKYGLENIKGLGRAAAGFERGTAKIKDALDAIKGRIGQYEFLQVPAMSRIPLNLAEIGEKLGDLRGPQFKQALKEIRSELNRLDLQETPKPKAGQVFMDRAPKYRRDPSAFSQLAKDVTPSLTGPTAKTVAGAQAIAPNKEGAPTGVLELEAAKDLGGATFGGLARHILPHLVP